MKISARSWILWGIIFSQTMCANVPGANCQTKSKNTVGAAESFDQVRDAANKAREGGLDEDAIRLYRKSLALRPDWQEGRWYLGTLLYEKERFPEARNELRRFVADDPTAGPGWAVLGMSEYQTRDYARSLEHLQKAMTLGLGGRKDLAQSEFYLAGVLLTRNEQYEDAMNLLIATARSVSQADFLVEPLGLTSLRMPFLPAEIPADRRELVQMTGKAALAVEAQQQDEADSLFRQMTERYPNEPGVHFLYGAFLMDLRPEDGVREMQEELKISPSHVGARLRLAEEYMKEQKFDQALSMAEEAVKLEPKSSGARLILGEALVAKGDLGKGIEELEKARKEAPGRIRTHWDLLRAYTSAGRSADAKREKEEIEKLSRPETTP